ncbi:transposase domain-containing protein [Rhizophagus irregularis DAOM 181602=DAOM 197198]|nr:transposase domain-containing protein [Rhizophagus irregularis DAOM 181602=DAOM 197198]
MIIPGPRSPKNFNSFLCPLIKELQELEEGVQCIDGRTNEPFILHAHLLTWTGDVLALSKSLNLSGHNSYKGCHFCMIKGTYHPSNKHIYYPSSAFCNIKNHDDTINMGKLIEKKTSKDRKDEMIRETGIKGSSELLKLQTLLFPWSFPTDIMHLFFENVVPSMYAHWSGKFFYNNLLLSSDYELSKLQWKSIGIQMEKVKKDMPIEIGRPPRDIFKYHNGYKAVEWRNWIILFYYHY